MVEGQPLPTPTHLPTYFLDTDFRSLFRDHPLPEEFRTGMFQWSPDQIRAHQERLFRSIMDVAWKNPFYRDVWSHSGVVRGDLVSLDDLQHLPIVTVDDFKRAIDEHPPFGLHQGIGVADAAIGPLKIQSSGGTTGRPRPTFFTPREWEVQAIQTARSLYLQGAAPGDVLHIPVTLSTANMGWCYFQAAFYYLGVVPITPGSGVVTETTKQVELMRDWGANILVGFPEYVLHLADVAQRKGIDPTGMGLKFVTTYLGPDTEGSLRAEIERTWGCPVFDNYGTHEIGVASFECGERDGLHINEDTLFFEVVDVDTNEPVPAGEVGNLVVTSLYRHHPPLVRYNLMDRVRLLPPGACRCGSHMRRMDHFLGRSDDMVKLRGVNIYPMACLSAVQSDPRSTGQWLCVVDAISDQGRAPRDEMTVLIEVRDGAGDLEGFAEQMGARLRVDLGARVRVDAVAAGSLAEATNFGREGKVRRLRDRRPGHERKY